MNGAATMVETPVQKALDELKRRNPGRRPVTNYFFQPMDRVSNLRIFASAGSVYFLHDEWDFARLYFCTFDIADLESELRKNSWPPIVVADWISREASEPVHTLFKSLGFHLHTEYERICCKSLRPERTNAELLFASPSDRDAIHALLFRVFDKYADHIMPLENLEGFIDRQEVILSRGAQAIDGLVVLPIEGQSCHFNFLYHAGGPLGLARLLGNFYGVLTERGARSGFGWVRRTRPMVLRLHESFGWARDGMVDSIYLR